MSQESPSRPQATNATAADSTEHSTLGAYVTGGAEFNRDTNYIEPRITTMPGRGLLISIRAGWTLCLASSASSAPVSGASRIARAASRGVYRSGFAGSQEAYDAAYTRLWAALDWFEERLTASSPPWPGSMPSTTGFSSATGRS